MKMVTFPRRHMGRTQKPAYFIVSFSCNLHPDESSGKENKSAFNKMSS
jgi:hypothetical protein